MMRSRVVLVDLPEDGRRVMNCTRFPAEHTARPTTYLSGKGEFRSWKNTNCCVGILRRSEPSSRPLQPIRKDLVIRFRRQRLAREAIMAAKEISVKKYVVRLSGEERERLETLLRKGKSPARRVLKARILLKADVSEAGKGWSDNRIIEALETSPSMVYRVRKQLVE